MGRISALTELTSLASDDYLVVLDSSANIAKKITIANAFGIPNLGYTAAGESWTYASGTTITVPTDATTKYQRGNIIKITQTTGGTKYGVITTVAATLLTIEWLNGATLANEAITSPYYSSNATPLGAGGIAHEMLSTGSDWAWDSWTPTLTNLTIGNGTVTARYKQIGKTVFYRLVITLGSTSSMGTGPTFTLPVTPKTIGGSGSGSIKIGDAHYEDNGTTSVEGMVYMNAASPSSTVTLVSTNAAGTYIQGATVNSTSPFTFGNGDEIRVTGFYEVS